MGRSLYQKLPEVVSLNWQEAQVVSLNWKEAQRLAYSVEQPSRLWCRSTALRRRSGWWAGRYIKCCPKLWPALEVRGVSVLYLLREGAEIFVCSLEMCVLIPTLESTR